MFAAQFSQSCAGCHANGGNVVEGAQTLKADALERNGLTSEEALYNITYNGKRKMPGFGEGCAPKGQCTFGKRLDDETIHGLAAYVADQARSGWPQP